MKLLCSVSTFQAYEKCFQNLHYMERYEEHTIAHAIQAKYEKTKVKYTHLGIKSASS